jgi:L-lysine 2,3-aminomutase
MAVLLDTDDDLICEMLKRKCFTLYQLVILRNISDMCERNKKLLDLLLASSVATFNLFVECLQTTQEHLVPLLTGKTGKVLLAF